MQTRTTSFLCVTALFAAAVCSAGAAELPPLWKIQQTLAAKRYVDLTHAFTPGIPRWPGVPDETRKTIYWYDKRPDTMGAGFFSELFTHVGQWGTHVDPPAHFIKGLRTVDQKMGNRAQPDSGRSFRRDADRLVEALARRGEDEE